MNWYYAEGGERRGPVTDAQLTTLVTSGKITPDTLVWNESMKDWQSADAAGLFAGSPPSIPPTIAPTEDAAVCIVTGKRLPTSQMLKTEHGWVSGEARDTYFQSLREGAPLPLAAGQTNAFADRKYIVVPVVDARLPQRCIKTNALVTDAEVKRRVLYWCTPWVLPALLLNILIVLILYFILRKKVTVDMPLSAEGRRRVMRNQAIAWALGVVGVALIVIPIINSNLVGLLLLGILSLLACAIVGLRKGSLLRVAKLKEGKAWLLGACPEYLASLPKYNG